MRNSLLVLIVLSASITVAAAGPNEGVILAVHGGQQPLPSCENVCEEMEAQLPGACEDLIPTSEGACFGLDVFLVIAVRPPESTMGINTVIFGIGDYDYNNCYIASYGPCREDLLPLEIPSDDWPFPNSGTAVNWAPACLERPIEPLYYFVMYSGASPEQIPLGDFYPNQTASVVNCDNSEDVIAGFGVMGCYGAPGANPDCPWEPTAVEETTWGSIKAIYR